MIKRTCPCGSDQTYFNCCKQYHDGKNPENALKLMKARYSAFANQKINFIFHTLHPAHPSASDTYPHFEQAIKEHLKNSKFEKLEILDFQEDNETATVTFVAHIKVGDHDATFTEKSTFEKVDDVWLYKSGVVKSGKEDLSS